MNQSVLNRARTDKFRLVLDLPATVKSSLDDVLDTYPTADTIQFTCFGSPTPNISVPSVDMAFGGQTLKTSSFSRPSYPPLTLNFLVDSGYQNWWILWKWMDLFNQHLQSTSEIVTKREEFDPILVNPFSDYLATFTIFTTDELHRNIMSFAYKGARITNLSEIRYNHQDATEIICSATFDYNQFTAELITDVNRCL